MQNLETILCPLCGARDERHLLQKGDFDLVRCNQCDLAYVNPRLSASALEALYNENAISPQRYYEENISQDIKHFGRRLAIIERYKRPGSLLDIGTNIGTLLKVAKDRGWSAQGVEFNRSAAAFGREKFGVPIDERDFMSAEILSASFDVVTMNDVIEHVTDPKATLREVHRILRPEGILFMTTPNIAAPLARVSGRYWLHLKPNEHLTYFTPATMQKLLEATGFELLHLRSIGRTRTVETILQKARAYSEIPYLIGRTIPRKVRESISLYIDPGDEMAVVARKK